MAILKTGTTIGGNTAWHSGNDGAGSGLDADLLDGINGGSFLRSDATTTYSGGLFRVTTPAGATGNNTAEVNTLQLYQATAGTDAYMSFHVGGDYAVHFGLDGSTNDLFVGGWSMGNNRYKVYHAGNVPTWNQNTTGTASNVTGTVAIANGGSGQTTAQAAMNAFAGAVTSGQYLRGNGTNVVMSAIQAGDVPTLNQNTTGSAGSVTNSVTFTSSGGASAGTTYNGSAARTIDYATVGAAAASHTHSYLPLSGGTLTGDITYGTTGLGLVWNMNTDGAYIKFYNTGDGDTNSRLEYGTSDNGDEFHRWMITSAEKMNLKTDGLNSSVPVNIYGGTANNANDATLYVTATNNNDWGLIVNKYNGSASEYGADIRVGSSALYGLRVTGNGAEVFRVSGSGALTATSKSFLIPHPTKEGWKLRYGSLEGPENGVYVRGKLKGGNVIELPGYWTKLVDPDSITVQLTPIGKHQKLYVEDIRDNKVYIANDGLFAGEINCFYYVQGERVDIEKLVVEYE